MYDIEHKDVIKLNPCKKCGADAVVKNKPLMYWIECSECDFSLRYFLNEEDAVNSWNNLK